MKTITSKILIFVILGILFFSCDKKETQTTVAPELPPVETMVIDFSKLDPYKSAEISKVNWIYAASTVSFWSTILGSTLVVPLAAFQSAIEHDPVRINDLAWQWQYDVDGFTSIYTARLVGKLESNHIKWEMYIAKTGINSFDEFLWFEGTSETDGNSGQWILYHSAESPVKLLQIDWQIEGGNVAQIEYTYIREKDSQNNVDLYNGSTLTYGLQDNELNAYVNVHIYNHQVEDFTDVFIEWATTSYNGRVKSEQFFEDSAWHCWDGQGNDIDCN